MKTTTLQADGRTVIKIAGDLLIAEVASAKSAINGAMAASDDIEIDAGEIGECDTAGIQLLLMARAGALAQGKHFTIARHSDATRAMIERVGIPVTCFNCHLVGCVGCLERRN